MREARVEAGGRRGWGGRAVLALAAGVLLAGCSAAPPLVPAAPVATLGGVAFGGMQWQARVARLPGAPDTLALQRELQAALDGVDALLSSWRPDSELSRFLREPPGQWYPVSPELLRCVATAAEVSAWSQGAYDVTVGPLVDLWGFGPAPAGDALPTEAAIAAARARVDWRQLEIDPAAVALRRRSDAGLDLSSVGEGAGVEALAAVLDQRSVHDYLVRVAGTLRSRGVRADGEPWRAAIERPQGADLLPRYLRLEDAVVSSSGGYRKFRTLGGRRYSHTLDPRTGYPVMHTGVAVTVVLPASAGARRADALATALNVLGPDAGLALAERDGLAVYYLEQSGTGLRERWSTAFAAHLAD